MQCAIGGRESVIGAPLGLRCRGGLTPLPAAGLRTLHRRRRGSRLSVKAHLHDIHAADHLLDAISNSGLSHHLAYVSHQIANFLYTVADESAVADAGAATSSAVTDAAATATDAAAAANNGGAGPFGFLADAFEAFLKVIDGGLEALGVPYSYGFAIIVLTVLVKAATFPLSKQQVESSLAMQNLQPRVKELQAKYQNNPERLQQETAALYQEAGVNPLAGCLPTLATIPIFIGLYRALSKAADEGLLSDGFFFVPSLAGPTTISARQAGLGLSWLFPFEDNQPPVGWHDAVAYLILPALLIVSQVVSQRIISPKSNDPQQQQAQAFLKFLPFLLGWFSLNVPSGLTLYWITNNILSTAQQAYLKSNTKPPELKPLGTIVKEKEEPVKKVTGAELGARRSKDGSKGSKFRARKAKEAASKAAEAVQEVPPVPAAPAIKMDVEPMEVAVDSIAVPAPDMKIAPETSTGPEILAEVTSIPVPPTTTESESDMEEEEPKTSDSAAAIPALVEEEVEEVVAVGAVAEAGKKGGRKKAKGKKGKKKGKKN